jgi:selenocysteine-specific elongation factor
VHFHLGTAEVLARVHPRSALEPGGEVLARIALETPVVARGGDRFVVRSYSPVTTIGGGRVLDPSPPRRSASWPDALGSPREVDRLHALVERRHGGLGLEFVPLVLGCVPEAGRRLLAETEGRLAMVGERVMLRAAVEDVRREIVAAIERYHAARPSEPGIPLGELRQGAGRGPLADAAIGRLVNEGKLTVAEGRARLADFRPGGDSAEEQVDRVVAALEAAGLTPPVVAELEAHLEMPGLRTVLRRAAAQGRVIGVESDRFYATAALDRFVAAVREEGRRGGITPAGLRERLGLSRKFLIPLLEWSDARGLTVRTGDTRRLR